jgi:hypothetical protein
LRETWPIFACSWLFRGPGAIGPFVVGVLRDAAPLFLPRDFAATFFVLLATAVPSVSQLPA